MHLRGVSAVDNLPTRWCTSTLGFTCSSVFGCNISEQVDWERCSVTLATKIAGYHPPLDFFLWGYVKAKVFSTPVPDITILTARITDAFATITEDMLGNTWRETDYLLDVHRSTKGAHVAVYWCAVKKKTSWVTFRKKKCLYSTYSCFVVINDCNQGKTLCSPCILRRLADQYCIGRGNGYLFSQYFEEHKYEYRVLQNAEF